ncbi:hypothetical protein CEXT_597681 [Caerostris extrusa]|uniref:SET domain-containing protein n=1 Tax=Caerostris extrusa TaxID=172846 RepID=A0AAV4RRU8_CAEEX|nr:hypothetical protein CEXT_597681 [Caerostris extrusa]
MERIHHKNIQICLERYIGKDNVPDEETLLTIVRKVSCNNFTFGSKKPVIRALFIGASKFDHSCVPNANMNFQGNTIEFRAIKMISVSEKITHSYCPMFSHFSAAELHDIMKNSFGEACYCNDCSQPFGTSTLTKSTKSRPCC